MPADIILENEQVKITGGDLVITRGEIKVARGSTRLTGSGLSGVKEIQANRVNAHQTTTQKLVVGPLSPREDVAAGGKMVVQNKRRQDTVVLDGTRGDITLEGVGSLKAKLRSIERALRRVR